MPPLPYAQSQGQGALLNALMNGGGNGSPMAQAQSPGLPMGADQSLVDQAYGSVDIGQRPEVAKRSALATILTGLGDALNAKASVLGRMDLNTDNSKVYNEYLLGTKRAAEDYDRLKAAQEGAGKRDKARYLLDEKARTGREAIDSQRHAEDVAWREAQAKQASDQFAATEARLTAQEQAQIEARKALEKMGNDNAIKLKNLEIGMYNDRKKGEGDDKQHDEYIKGKQFLASKVGEWEEALKAGTMKPEQIAKQWSLMLKASDLAPGKYRDAMNAFFDSEVGPLLMQYGPAQGPAVNPEPGPTQEAPFIGGMPNIGAIGPMVGNTAMRGLAALGRGTRKPEYR